MQMQENKFLKNYFQESETIELKEIVVDDIKKEIIAFANSGGGKLYIGVKDDGTVIGIDDADSACLQVANMVRDAIKPDVTMFVHYETITCNGKQIVEVVVGRGTDRPYYLAKKWMRPEGVYIRQGYSSVPATDTAIRYMIKETDGERFEAMRSINQALSFDTAKKEFAIRKIKFGRGQMQTLKLLDTDGLYTNLGQLLSEECIQTIKVAAFQGTGQMVFKDRREFSGSLLRQMNEVYEYIDFRNQTHSTIEKLIRIDERDYPETAVREALLNLIVHRDYAISASALIRIFDDRIEFVSLGGLMPGIEQADIMAGISVCRNRDLAEVFYRLHLIEAYGTGMTKIMEAYKGSRALPVIEATPNTFKITLPNKNAKYETDAYDSVLEERTVKYEAGLPSDHEEEMILRYIKAYGKISKLDATALLKVSPSTAYRVLTRMLEAGAISKSGRARNTVYYIDK